MTVRRLRLNQIAEPPGSRVLYRVDRADHKSTKYGRPLLTAQRNHLAFWARRPPT